MAIRAVGEANRPHRLWEQCVARIPQPQIPGEDLVGETGKNVEIALHIEEGASDIVWRCCCNQEVRRPIASLSGSGHIDLRPEAQARGLADVIEFEDDTLALS